MYKILNIQCILYRLNHLRKQVDQTIELKQVTKKITMSRKQGKKIQLKT